MNQMKKKTKTNTLIVTETIRYEFEVPASMPEDEETLKRFFGRLRDPWADADFAAVTDREFEIELQEEYSRGERAAPCQGSLR